MTHHQLQPQVPVALHLARINVLRTEAEALEDAGDLAAALAKYEEALAINVRLGNRASQAIILNNPSNPTGSAYTRSQLMEVCEVAADEGLIIIADEIYANIVYDGRGRLHMSEWIGDVPGIAMRGISVARSPRARRSRAT